MSITLRWSHGGTGGDVYVCEGDDGCGLEVREAQMSRHVRFHDRLAELDDALGAQEILTASVILDPPGSRPDPTRG